MLAAFRIDELLAQRLEAFERAFLVRPHQPRIPRHIGGEDRGEFAFDRGHVDQPLVLRPQFVGRELGAGNQRVELGQTSCG